MDDPTARRFAAAVVRDMNHILDEQKNGIGLAAPQAGHAVRIIILAPQTHERLVMVNPHIGRRGNKTKVMREGCLSYPGVSALVKRHTFFEGWYDDLDGKGFQCDFSGWHARIIQHEIDHLNGICKVGDAWRAAKKPEMALA